MRCSHGTTNCRRDACRREAARRRGSGHGSTSVSYDESPSSGGYNPADSGTSSYGSYASGSSSSSSDSGSSSSGDY